MDDSTMMESSSPLFEGLTFTIVPNGISKDKHKKIVNDIEAGGGAIISFDASRGRPEKLEQCTHIVSNTSDFPDYHKALDLFIHTVKPSWIDASIKANKPKNPRQFSPDPQLYMSDVVICCGDIPEGDKECIEGAVVGAGGQYLPTLSKLVTHLIALDIEDKRCQLALQKKVDAFIVLPHWFDDCMRLGRRIHERPYQLPDPEILNVNAGAIPPSRVSAHIRNATNPEPANDPFPPTPPEQIEPPRQITAFNGKKVKLSDDLPLSDRLRTVVTSLIEAGGGELTESVEQADVYVCTYRDGSDYMWACQAKKDVGNLAWLYYMITYNAWTNPMRRLLHYPRPRGGIPGFSGYKMCISNYTGEARVYLENLVKATGAEFTKVFKQDNTHLISASSTGDKCDAAQEWGVHVVNHLWLEESYAKCKEMTLTDPRYTYFPPRTNLGEILGQIEVDRATVEKGLSKPLRAKATKAALPNADLPDSSVVDSRTASPPLAGKNGRKKTKADVATPVAPRRAEGKENDTPGTTGSRGAKDRALSKLHNAAPDIAKFEKEMKRKGGVIHGGRREKQAEPVEKSKKAKPRDSTSSKRSIDEVDEDETEEEAAEETAAKGKNAKKQKLTPIKYRMLVSGDKRWQNNQEKESKNKARLRELGVFLTDDARNVDLLCAPKVVRTKKFVAALACGPTIVHSSYLDFALKNNKLPPAEKHILRDRDFEKQHGFKLDDALERAEQNQKRLLRDWTIFCSPAVAGGFDTFKDIVVTNGGVCNLWKGRATTVFTASKRAVDRAMTTDESQNQQEDEGDVLYLVSEPKKSEFKNWESFRALARRHDMVPRIVRTEWLLFVAMAQFVHWRPEWELSEEGVRAMG